MLRRRARCENTYSQYRPRGTNLDWGSKASYETMSVVSLRPAFLQALGYWHGELRRHEALGERHMRRPTVVNSRKPTMAGGLIGRSTRLADTTDAV